MHKILTLMLCFLLNNGVFAQHINNDSLIIPQNEWFLKLSPLAIFETDGGVGFSGEYVLPKLKLGLQLELQPILFDPYRRENSNGLDAPFRTQTSGMPLGIKLRPEVRYYLEGLRSRPYHPHIVTKAGGTPFYHKPASRIYVAADFLFKQTWIQRTADLEISNGGTQPALLQRATFTDVKQVLGGDIKLGTVSPLSRNGRWWLEAYLGIGARIKKFSYHKLPAGASKPSRSNVGYPRSTVNETGTASQGMPSFPAGFRLVYRL